MKPTLLRETFKPQIGIDSRTVITGTTSYWDTGNWDEGTLWDGIYYTAKTAMNVVKEKLGISMSKIKPSMFISKDKPSIKR